jgi:SAM-dependent methyltransferase
MSIDASGPNAEQIEFWNGEAADAWVGAQQRMDQMLAPLSAQALKAANVTQGERVLDIGCGCGGTAVQIANQGATVTGVDISAPMLERARQRGEGRDDLAFVLADASSHNFAADHDLVFSRFGVMFFKDPKAAFTNIARALKPGGRLCFLCWQEAKINYWMSVPGRAAAEFLPPPEPVDPKAPGPFAFAEANYLEEILAAAGFQNVSIESYIPSMQLGGDIDTAIDFLVHVGPMSRTMADLDDDTRLKALSAVQQALAPHADKDGVALDGACWIVTGTL